MINIWNVQIISKILKLTSPISSFLVWLLENFNGPLWLTVRTGGSITPLVGTALELVESAVALILGGCQARVWNPLQAL